MCPNQHKIKKNFQFNHQEYIDYLKKYDASSLESLQDKLNECNNYKTDLERQKNKLLGDNKSDRRRVNRKVFENIKKVNDKEKEIDAIDSLVVDIRKEINNKNKNKNKNKNLAMERRAKSKNNRKKPKRNRRSGPTNVSAKHSMGSRVHEYSTSSGYGSYSDNSLYNQPEKDDKESTSEITDQDRPQLSEENNLPTCPSQFDRQQSTNQFIPFTASRVSQSLADASKNPMDDDKAIIAFIPSKDLANHQSKVEQPLLSHWVEKVKEIKLDNKCNLSTLNKDQPHCSRDLGPDEILSVPENRRATGTQFFEHNHVMRNGIPHIPVLIPLVSFDDVNINELGQDSHVTPRRVRVLQYDQGAITKTVLAILINKVTHYFPLEEV